VKIALAGLGLVAALMSAPHAAAEPTTVFFKSPLDGLSCEVDWQQSDIADQVYCQTYSPPRTVKMDVNGVLTTCKDFDQPAGAAPCSLGDPPENTATLAYGQTSVTGPFTCASAETGISCTIATGLGFTISGMGITPIG
jgi:hypothetical protein